MVLAWSSTEIIRYAFYAVSILQCEPRWLLWLRYTTFYVLYPIGAGSEAALIYSTLPLQKGWNAWDYGRAAMFLIWWPGKHVHPTIIKMILSVFDVRSLRDVHLYDQAAQEGFRDWDSQSQQRRQSQLNPDIRCSYFIS